MTRSFHDMVVKQSDPEREHREREQAREEIRGLTDGDLRGEWLRASQASAMALVRDRVQEASRESVRRSLAREEILRRAGEPAGTEA